MPLYGHELDESIDPYRAGLGFACKLADRQFLGSESLSRISQSPLAAKRVGLVLDGKRAARQGASILDADSRTVGLVTSGSFSPTLDRPIAMAYVEPSIASDQSRLDIDIRGSRVSATIVPLPFYKRASST